jgi:hypothetical protein
MSEDTKTKSPVYPFASGGRGSLKAVVKILLQGRTNVMGARDLARLRVASEPGSGFHGGGN